MALNLGRLELPPISAFAFINNARMSIRNKQSSRLRTNINQSASHLGFMCKATLLERARGKWVDIDFYLYRLDFTEYHRRIQYGCGFLIR